MRLKNLDLIMAVIIAGLNVLYALLPNRIPVIGIILALPLVFVLPGYMLTEILFHKRSLDVSHRLVLSLGVSLAIDILGGVILNLLPGGLQAISWAVLLGLFTTVFSLFAAYLRRGTGMNGARPVRFRLTFYPWILFGAATVVAILAVVYSVIGATQQPYPGFTQLWMLPAVQPGKSCAVRLGVRSFETTPVKYRLTMVTNGDQGTTWPSVVLAPQEEWDQLVPIIPKTTENVHVEAQLYQLDKPQAVYRKVNVTLYGCPAAQINPSLASAYSGIMYNIPLGLKTKISLTRIQQSHSNIRGYFTGSQVNGLRVNEAFTGMIQAHGQIHFTVAEYAGQVILAFDGSLLSGGTLAGSYCNLDHQGKCAGEYGLWSVTPVAT